MKKIKIKLKNNIQLKKAYVGGSHTHQIKDNKNTQNDGVHWHSFLINNTIIFTKMNGIHTHEIDNNIAVGGSGHQHIIFVNGLELNTNIENGHTHGFDADGSISESGLHNHKLTLEDGIIIESLDPTDITVKNLTKKYKIDIQSIHFDKNIFSRVEVAAQWLDKNGLDFNNVNEIGSHITFTQQNKDIFIEESLKVFNITEGIHALVGTLKQDDLNNENKQNEILNDSNILNENEVSLLNNLKIEFAQMLINLKANLLNVITNLDILIDFSDKLMIENEIETIDNFHVGVNILNDNLSKIEGICIKKSNTNVDVFQNDLLNFIDNIQKVNELFNKTDKYNKFKNICSVLEKRAVNISDEILPKLLMFVNKNIGIDLKTIINIDLDLEVTTVEKIQNIDKNILSKIKLTKINHSNLKTIHNRLEALYNKLFINKNAMLDLGCGINKKSEYIGIDKIHTGDNDLIYDLNDGIPLPDNSISKINATEIMEKIHSDNVVFLMKEIYRVLKNSGILFFKSASTNGGNSFFHDNNSLWNELILKSFGSDICKDKYGFNGFEIEKIENEVLKEHHFVVAKMRVIK